MPMRKIPVVHSELVSNILLANDAIPALEVSLTSRHGASHIIDPESSIKGPLCSTFNRRWNGHCNSNDAASYHNHTFPEKRPILGIARIIIPFPSNNEDDITVHAMRV